MRLGGTDQWPTSQKGISLSWLHVISYFDSMALFLWPSWSSLVLETLLRRPLFFLYKRAYKKRPQLDGQYFLEDAQERSESGGLSMVVLLFLWRGVIRVLVPLQVLFSFSQSTES